MLGGPVEVWEAPQPGVFYHLGQDLAEGRTEQADWSVGCVVRRDTLAQVAQFRVHENPASTDFLDLVYWLGMTYNCAEINPDITGGWGNALLTELQYRNYPNIWRWRRRDDAKQRVSSRIGFLFTKRDKAHLVGNAVALATRGEVSVASETLLDEMRTYLNIGLDEWSAAPGQYDDACFIGETLVEVGEYTKPIRDVQIGERVLTHSGVLLPVLTTSRRETTGLVKLDVTGLTDPVACTPEHRLLTWAPARYPNGSLRRSPKHQFHPWKEGGNWTAAKDLRKGDFLFIPKRQLPPTVIPPDLLYLLGWYLADGNLTPTGQLRIILAEREERCAKRLLEIITTFNEKHPSEWIAGYGSWRHRRIKVSGVRMFPSAHMRAIEVTTCARPLAEFLWKYGGAARHKSIEPSLYQSSGLLPLALGFIEGDGSQRVTGAMVVAQKDRRLLKQIRQILLDNGVWCTEGSRRTDQELWTLHISAPDLNKLLAQCPSEIYTQTNRTDYRVVAYESAFGFWAPLQRVEVDPCQAAEVYNLEVPGDESYVAGGIAAHNCTAWMLALLSARDERSSSGQALAPEESVIAKPAHAWHNVDADLEDEETTALIRMEPWKG